MQTGRMGRKIAREQWKAVAVRLALRGYSVRRIAEKIGRARSTVQDALNEALQEASPTPEETERRRNEMRARLMRQLEAWAIKSIKGDEKAGAIVVRLEERLAKVDGIDAPARVDMTLATREIDQFLDRLEQALTPDEFLRVAAIAAGEKGEAAPPAAASEPSDGVDAVGG